MDLSGKKVVVVGLGQSGIAAARLAEKHGAKVLGTDSRSQAELGKALAGLKFELALGGHPQQHLDSADLIVVSPGVPPLREIDAAEKSGVPVIGELDFAARFVSFPLIAVGGTNGKSTTTLLLSHILQGAGLKVFSGGNLGVPLSDAALAAEQGYEVGVVEVSSFQLERAPSFCPNIGLLLNITEDHLDRYPDFQAYANAKGNAFVNQSTQDLAVVPEGDSLCLEQVKRGSANILSFGDDGDYTVEGRKIVEQRTGESLDLAGVDLYGKHNLLNAAAAVAAVRGIGLPWEKLEPGLKSFKPLPHRMSKVRELDSVTYYDDSKATNVGAAVTAVMGLAEERCVLIAGGRDKQGSYKPLVDALRLKGRALITLGEAGALIAEAAKGVLDVQSVAGMADAVRAARRLAQSGDAVLLSPACSSFDMYQSYGERGEDFARLVMAE